MNKDVSRVELALRKELGALFYYAYFRNGAIVPKYFWPQKVIFLSFSIMNAFIH